MKILDISGNIISEPDLNRGYLKDEKIFKERHEAVPEVKEQWHHEVIAEYPNGGKDLKKVIDVPYSPAIEAYDEYEDIQRYIEYSAEELAAIEAEREKQKILEQEVQELREAITLLLSGGTE